MSNYTTYLRSYASPRDDSAYTGLDADFGRRLMAMLQAAPEHVRRPDLIESLARDNETQARAIRDVAARRGIPFTPMLLARGIPGYAAPVGGSQHQSGRAADLNLGRLSPEARDWLRSNVGAYGLRFPLPDTDAGHLEYDAGWRGELPNARPASVSGLPVSPPAIMNSALLGLSASRPAPETSMPPIVSQALREFRDGGAVEAALRIAVKQTDRNPSDAAKEAGNYAKGKVRIHSMEIAIENPKGSQRSGVDKSGKPWTCELPAHYGYLLGTVGADKDHVDCYIGPDHSSDKVFVVDQINAETGKWDEHKVMFDFPSKQSALTAYEKAFSDGKGRDRIGSVSEMSVADFRQWLKNGNTKKPVGDLKQNFANGGTVMPLYKGEKNVGRNISTLQGEGKKRSQSIAIALDVARRAYGGRVGYAEGGDVDPLVPGGLPPPPSTLDAMDWTPDTERRRLFGPPAPVARSANTAMGDLLAHYTGSVDVGRNVSGLERGAGDVFDTAYQFTGIPLAAEAGRHMAEAVDTGDILRGLGAVGEMGIAALPVARPMRQAIASSGMLGRIGTGATIGGAPVLASGALSSDANAQTAAPPATDNLRALLEQRAGTQQLTEDARRRREAFRPKNNRRPTPQDDPQFTEADAEYTRLSNTLKALDETIKGEREKHTPEYLARARRTAATEDERERQVREAVEARDKVRRDAPKPFNENFPWLAPFMPAMPIIAGAATGAMMGRSRLRGENTRLQEWNDALARASTTTSPRIRSEMIETAENINDTWPKQNLLNKTGAYLAPGVVGGIEGALATGLPPAYNSIMLPTTNPERTALQEYYRRLPEDHPERARTLAMLNNETALPRQSPPAIEAREYFTNWRENALPRMAAGAFEGAAATMPGTTVTNMMRPHEMALPRARTNAMVANRPPREILESPRTARAPEALPTPLPALPAPIPTPGPPAALSPTPPLTGPSSRTSTSASERPYHHSQDMRRNDLGQFAGPAKKPKRRGTRDRDIENDPDHDPNTRTLRGRKDGGWVQSALNLARRYAGGGRAVAPVSYAPDNQELPLADLASMPMPRALDLSSEMEGMRGVRPSRMELPMVRPSRFNDASDPLAGFGAYASGGEVSQGSVVGPVIGPTGGREDALPINVESGSYVLPSDLVSGVGGGNTIAGHKALERLFGKSDPSRATGGPVAIKISDGEHVLTREQVERVGNGDYERGCRALDAFVKQQRAQTIKTLKGLPGPAQG